MFQNVIYGICDWHFKDPVLVFCMIYRHYVLKHVGDTENIS